MLFAAEPRRSTGSARFTAGFHGGPCTAPCMLMPCLGDVESPRAGTGGRSVPVGIACGACAYLPAGDVVLLPADGD